MSTSEEIIAALDNLLLYDISAADQVTQTAIVRAAQRLLAKFQTPTDKVMELCWDYPAAYASVTILLDLGIWNAWAKMSGGTQSLDQIRDMANTDVEPKLLCRVLLQSSPRDFISNFP